MHWQRKAAIPGSRSSECRTVTDAGGRKKPSSSCGGAMLRMCPIETQARPWWQKKSRSPSRRASGATR